MYKLCKLFISSITSHNIYLIYFITPNTMSLGSRGMDQRSESHQISAWTFKAMPETLMDA